MTVDQYKTYAAGLLLEPDNPEYLVDQFSILSNKGDKANGKHYFYLAKRAYEIAPDEINTAFNYASALHRTGDFAKAKDLFLWCLGKADETWLTQCLHHVGIAYRALNQNEKAIEYYEKAFARSGDPAIAKDRALAIMASGKLKQGLEAFECRREWAEQKYQKNGGQLIAQQKLPAGVVHWKGEDLNGKKLVVYHEEGVGDFIQFCRFIPKAKERGAKVYLTGPVPDLLDLVSDQIEFDGVVPLSGPFESDYVVGSMTLPWRLGIDYPDVNGKPYFDAEPATFPLRGKLNVGLVWRGNPVYGMDAHRSMPFSDLCPLFDLKDIAFYSLQVGPASSEVGKLGFDGFIADLAPFAKNWRATARLLKRLDAVVTVDTAVSHLAGALGVPSLMMVTKASDWRWDRSSEKTVWYDSVRVYRQKDQDDWAPCVQRVRKRLTEMLSGRRQDASSDSQSFSRQSAA